MYEESFALFSRVSYLVKQGGLELLRRFPVHERALKTAPFLRGSSSILLIEAPTFSTSPNMAKSLKSFKSVEMIRGHSTQSFGDIRCGGGTLFVRRPLGNRGRMGALIREWSLPSTPLEEL